MFDRLFRHMHAQTTETASRSDVLKPLVYAIGVLLTAELSFVVAKAPGWLLLTGGIFIGLALTAYLGAFVFCLLTNPDLLRSERYGLEKMAIERGVYGDSSTGLVETAKPEINNPRMIETEVTRG